MTCCMYVCVCASSSIIHHHKLAYSLALQAQHQHGFKSSLSTPSSFTPKKEEEEENEIEKMEVVSCESGSWISSSIHEDPEIESPAARSFSRAGEFDLVEMEEEAERERERLRMWTNSLGKNKKKKNQVLLEGYVETPDEDLTRTKSLTDEDLDELKGCLDLGFGFSYDEIPELCNTLPALELCYSMSQKFMDEHQKSPENSPQASLSPVDSLSSSMANWKISSPGEYYCLLVRLEFFVAMISTL